MTVPQSPWSVPVRLDEVPEEGRSFDLAADADARAVVARAASLNDLPRLQARFEVRRWGRGLRVQGAVEAIVVQSCVVTLEPVVNEVREEVDVSFRSGPVENAAGENEAIGSALGDPEPPELLAGDSVDLGALAVEFLLLGLDPYPRKPDAVFEAPAAPEPKDNPFAALAALKEPARGKK
jgi:uncharacterized metal-binding protein YceD (DUF177 family)